MSQRTYPKGWILLELREPLPQLDGVQPYKWIHSNRISEVEAWFYKEEEDKPDGVWIATALQMEDGKRYEILDMDGNMFYVLTGLSYDQAEKAMRDPWAHRGIEPEPPEWYGQSRIASADGG